MRVISPWVHGILDLLTVGVLVLGPIVLGLGGAPAAIAFALAAVHLILTLLTDFPMGASKKIPFFVHGIIELVVGIGLLILPSFAGYGPGSPARRFYLAMGAVILVVWALTAYRANTAHKLKEGRA